MNKLSEQLEYWRAERPDEWIMDDFIRKAKVFEDKVKSLQDDLNLADELHFEECAELQKKIVVLKRELLIKNRN